MNGTKFVAFLLFLSHGVNCQSPTTCAPKTFGQQCYPCHCKKKDTCDTDTGQCSKGVCGTGYSGPVCQMEPNSITGFEVYVSNSTKPSDWTGGAETLCFTDTTNKGKRTYTINCHGSFQPIYGKVVVVRLPRQGVLHFCELMVYRCASGWYGKQCEKECLKRHCAGGATQCKIDGTCEKGCVEGWSGTDCMSPCTSGCRKCDQFTSECIECTGGLYDKAGGCNKKCSERHCSAPRDRCSDDGFCPDCSDGWFGEDCITKCDIDCKRCDKQSGSCLECVDGRYGPNCSELCIKRHCLDETDCTRDGSCKSGCTDGWFGKNCSTHCSNFCKLCDQMNGQCIECKDGHYGTGCVMLCNNTARHCLDRTDCNEDGDCVNGCSKGWYGRNCSLSCPFTCDSCDIAGQCDKCEVGYYGFNCNKLCNDTERHCLVESDCSQDGSCSFGCENGWSGDNCSTPCSEYCEFCGKGNGKCLACKNGHYGKPEMCNNSTVCRGECGYRCSERHCADNTAVNCTIAGYCALCEAGWFGVDCFERCYSGCASCDKSTGVCDSCVPGMYGSNCSKPCHACIICHQDNGTCASCPRNKYDTNCSSSCSDRHCAYGMRYACPVDGFCNSCEDGWYGVDCSSSCGVGCSICNKTTGVCQECSLGYYGDNCSKPCVECSKCHRDNGSCIECKNLNNYGVHCMKNCTDRHCLGDRVMCDLDGRCDTCDEGWYGDDCTEQCHSYCRICNKTTGNCESCQDGYYGNNCNNSCPACATCDRISGNCLTCNNGTYGPNCTEKCAARHCLIRDVCPFNGSCVFSCKAGYYGDTCTLPCRDFAEKCSTCTLSGCTSCEPGYFGGTCNNTCPGGCSECFGTTNNDVTCSICNGSKFGRHCEHMCSSFCKHSVCSIASGDCKDGCENGRYGNACQHVCSPTCKKDEHGTVICDQKDGRCSNGCLVARYGGSCQLNCSGNCVKPGTCDRNGGLCTDGCAHGHYGSKCEKECDQNCGDKGPCDQLTGKCIRDTAKGEPAKNGDNLRMIIIIAAAGGLLVIIIGIVIAFIVARKRSKSGADFSYQRSTMADAESKSFENLVMDELGDDMHIDTTLAIGESVKYENEDAASDGRHMSISTFKGASTAVDLSDLWRHTLKMKALDLFRQQYDKLPCGLTAECTVANMPENVLKNKFSDTVAYDHSRVVLKELPGESNSDYINASYINGYDREKVYIASQGPTTDTLNDYLRMLWQVKSDVVITLTRAVEDDKIKCEKYWPDIVTETKAFTDFSIFLACVEPHDGFVVRTMDLVHNVSEQSMNFKQFHFTDWPDHGVPKIATSLITFHDLVKPAMRLNISPTIVHCCAGIGRSGTFIALDYLLEQGSEEGIIDVYKCVKDLRAQRVNMVPKIDQYTFLHEALIEAFHLDATSMRLSSFCDQYQQLCQIDLVSGDSNLTKLFESLDDLTPERRECDFKMAKSPENQSKNRSKNILASDYFRPYLTTIAEGCNDYINAIFMPKERGIPSKIITQTPLPNTAVDFWRLVYEQECSTVVMMHGEDNLDDRDVGVYWLDTYPEERVGPFIIKKLYSQQNDVFKVNTLKLICDKEMSKDAIHVKQFIFHAWPEMATVPPSPTSMLFLIDEIKQWQTQTSCPLMIVHCMNGADRSGLLCAVDAVLDKIKRDEVVSIPEILVTMRYRRDLLIRSFDQFEFCYEVVNTYIKNTADYKYNSDG